MNAEFWSMAHGQDIAYTQRCHLFPFLTKRRRIIGSSSGPVNQSPRRRATHNLGGQGRFIRFKALGDRWGKREGCLTHQGHDAGWKARDMRRRKLRKTCFGVCGTLRASRDSRCGTGGPFRVNTVTAAKRLGEFTSSRRAAWAGKDTGQGFGKVDGVLILIEVTWRRTRRHASRVADSNARRLDTISPLH